ncbi:MAG: hypothetical protein K6F35_00805 [Lachnospiraceae bacterium]|nr:hypothetical protein [Lachnospiraceae bacterium]
MKTKIMIGILALLLWITPLFAIYHYATVDANKKNYELVALDRAPSDQEGGIGNSINPYMVYAGSTTLIIIAIYALYLRKSRSREDEENERRASEYMKDLL